ncbi:MAG: hypothetical protein P4L98_23505 [Ancalomicrobiaceae bacterium]|nr:hypothetical protein [Ancalomicrobiaceae bacterium]
MNTLRIMLATLIIGSSFTAALAQPSDSIDQQVARQIALGNVKASNDSLPQGVVEGRQAAPLATGLTELDLFLIDHNRSRSNK